MKDIIASTCVGFGQTAIGHPFDTALVLIQNKIEIHKILNSWLMDILL